MMMSITIPAGTTFTFTSDTTCEICKQVIDVIIPCRPVVNYDAEIGWAHTKCLETQENKKGSTNINAQEIIEK